MSTQGKAKLWLVLLMSILAFMAAGAANYLRTNRPLSPSSQVPPSTQTPSPDTSQKQPSTSLATSSGGGTTVKVFFSKHPDSDTDPTRTFSIDYPNVTTAAVATYALEQLIAGPNADLASRDYFSAVKLQGDSACGGRDFSLDIINNTATLMFCRELVMSGVAGDGQAKSEITDTLKQFSTVSKVIILNTKGTCQFDLSGQNQCLK